MPDDPNAQPPAGGAPAAPPPPAAPPASAAPAGAGKRRDVIEIPSDKFKKRVRQDALSYVKEQLGVDIEEAKRALDQARSGSSAAPPAAQQANAGEQRKLQQEKDRLHKENLDLKSKLGLSQKKSQDRIRELEDEIAERDLRGVAGTVGVSAQGLGYATYLYAEAKAADAKVQPQAFFESLKTTQPALFGASAPPAAAAPPPKVGATTAPPASPVPGASLPNAAPPGAPPAGEETADKMDARKFQERTRDKYGFTPPLGG